MRKNILGREGQGGNLRNNRPEMSYKMYIPLVENFIMQRNLKK